MKAWEPEEDRLIIELLGELGPRWSKIVQALPGRTISSIRNRWQRIEKGRKLLEEGAESKNRCQICGEPKRGHVCFEKIRRSAAERQTENDQGLADVLPDDLSDMAPETGTAGSSSQSGGIGPGSGDDDDNDDSLDVAELLAVERKATDEIIQRVGTSACTQMLSPPAANAWSSPTARQPSAAASYAAMSDAQVAERPRTSSHLGASGEHAESVAGPADARVGEKRSRRDAATMTDPYDEDEDEDEDPLHAPSLPIVRRIKSGERICTELGFDGAAAAADGGDAASPIDDEVHGIVPLVPSRGASTRAAELDKDLVLPSRLPSVLSPRPSFGEPAP